MLLSGPSELGHQNMAGTNSYRKRVRIQEGETGCGRSSATRKERWKRDKESGKIVETVCVISATVKQDVVSSVDASRH